MRPRGYIFDYGGTLDTGGHHWGKVLWHGYEHCQVPFVKEEEFRQAYVYAERTLGRNPIIRPDFTFRQTLQAKLRLQFQYLFDHACWVPFEPAPDGSLPMDQADAVVDYVYRQTVQQTSHSVDVLRSMRGDAAFVLVSNFYGNISVVLHEFGFDGLFDHVIESAVVGVRKPDPRIFQMGVEAMGLTPGEVVVVGDSMDKDIIPAKSIGCQTVWYEGEQWTDDPVDRSIPHHIIKDLDELKAIRRS